MPEETKNEEILEAINTFANHTQNEFESIKSDIGAIKSDMGIMKSDIKTMNSDMGTMKSDMVTKDYLDEKLADLRGDMVVLTRKEDKKVMILVDILKDRKLIDEEDVKRIQSMEPFAQSL